MTKRHGNAWGQQYRVLGNTAASLFFSATHHRHTPGTIFFILFEEEGKKNKHYSSKWNLNKYRHQLVVTRNSMCATTQAASW